MNKETFLRERKDPRLLLAGLTPRNNETYDPFYNEDPIDVAMAFSFLDDEEYYLLFGKYIGDRQSLRRINTYLRERFQLADDNKSYEQALIDFVAYPLKDPPKSGIRRKIFDYLRSLELSGTEKIARLLGLGLSEYDAHEVH